MACPWFVVRPFFAAASAEQQQAAFRPPQTAPPTRKFVLATNIAETSVTVRGVRFVVDCGLAKHRPSWLPRAWTRSRRRRLAVRGEAAQRAGGARGPGKCWRLYQEAHFERLPLSPVPEVMRVDLSEVVLQLLVVGIGGRDIVGGGTFNGGSFVLGGLLSSSSIPLRPRRPRRPRRRCRPSTS